MKIRSDYVSNSSSSSFIIGENEIFNNFNITKQDILDALIDAYGVDAYEKSVEDFKKDCDEFPDYYAKNIKYKDYGPFYVYDLSDEDDKNQAIDMWGSLLKDWTATNAHRLADGSVEYDARNVKRFEDIVCDMAAIYGASGYSIIGYLDGNTNEYPTKFIYSQDADPVTGRHGHEEPLDKIVVDVARDMMNKVGYMTNLDALKCDLARFFVHADDNALPCSDANDKWDGNEDKYVNPNFTSDAYTYDRVCEIIYNYLVKKGKIKPNDPTFMEQMRIDDEHLSSWNKENGYLWDFVNGKNLTYEDLCYSTLTQCMHEG